MDFWRFLIQNTLAAFAVEILRGANGAPLRMTSLCYMAPKAEDGKVLCYVAPKAADGKALCYMAAKAEDDKVLCWRQRLRITCPAF